MDLLKHLELLENEARELSKGQNEMKIHFEEIQDLRNTCARLRQKYARLTNEYQNLQTISTTESDFIQLTAEDEQQLEKLIQLKQFEQIQKGYRITCGITLFDIPKELIKTIGARFETFSFGKFHESFYIIFQKSENGIEIYKHTIPHFIPLQRIHEETFSISIKLFLEEISKYLDAFIYRREQLKLIRNIVSEINTTESLDLIRFNIKDKRYYFIVKDKRSYLIDHHRILVKLVYRMKETQPHRVSVTRNRRRIHSLEELFLTKSLKEVLSLPDLSDIILS